MKVVFLSLSVFSFFLFPAFNAWGQATQKEVVQQWIKEQKAKLPADIQSLMTMDLKNHDTPYYENWAQDPPLNELHKKGIPRAYKEKKDSPPSKLENVYRFVLEGYSLVIAEYAGNISELYFKKRTGYKQLFHFAPCNKIRLIKPGEKAPVLILIHVSACGSGWDETIYSLGKNGFLNEAGHLGGQNAVTKYVDIDNDGIMEIINTSSTKHYPLELENKLKDMKIYQEPTGPVLNDTVIFKWNGEKFAKIAEYFDQVE